MLAMQFDHESGRSGDVWIGGQGMKIPLRTRLSRPAVSPSECRKLHYFVEVATDAAVPMP
jgi:hypothetical protein